jgi:hypothetical protein
MGVLVASLVLVLQVLPLSLELFAQVLAGAASRVEPIAAGWTVAHVVWRTFVQPAIPYVLGLALVTATTCALGGAALMHLGSGKAALR